MEILGKSDERVLVSLAVGEFREAFGQKALIEFGARQEMATAPASMDADGEVRTAGGKICKRCGKEFIDRSATRNRKYCTKRCYKAVDCQRHEKNRRRGGVEVAGLGRMAFGAKGE